MLTLTSVDRHNFGKALEGKTIDKIRDFTQEEELQTGFYPQDNIVIEFSDGTSFLLEAMGGVFGNLFLIELKS